MPATVVNLVDAVVDALNGTGSPLVGGAKAVRSFMPRRELSALKDLAVTVVPRSLDLSSPSRSTTQGDVQIDVAVQQRLSGDTAQEAQQIDTLLELVEQVSAFIRTTAVFGTGSWVRTVVEPLYAVEHLSELRVFTSVLTLTLRRWS